MWYWFLPLLDRKMTTPEGAPEGFKWFEEFKQMKQDIEKLKKIAKELHNEIGKIHFHNLQMAVAEVCKMNEIDMDDYKTHDEPPKYDKPNSP
jgi:hypothetical protein